MNGKISKFLRKLSRTMKYDYDFMKKEFKGLDRNTKGRFHRKMGHMVNTITAARAKA